MDYNLKDEKEVQEYLKNLYTEYTFSCCKEKSPAACHLLGDYEESINKEYVKAAEIYKNNCDEFAYGRSCAKYGGYTSVGKGCPKDLEQSFKYLKKGCENEDSIGCVNYGLICLNPEYSGSDKTERMRNGVEALKKSCFQMDQEKGCFQLAGIYITGIPGVVEKNFGEAYRASLKCCEFGNPYACGNISQMHKKGEGAEKNAELAAVFKERAIELHKNLTQVRESIKFQQ